MLSLSPFPAETVLLLNVFFPALVVESNSGADGVTGDEARTLHWRGTSGSELSAHNDGDDSPYGAKGGESW